ncbi:hypothetical protein BVRB_015060 [Beta vulgaris subsp. vulgaris]|uniref:Uncharacterized protein n=1 Tax=Beta vulgaris subsp. vulgaris TaxID=3555 RepID=A0A0J8B4Q1_BETVV|nr:hypothetical protein BVRB_015060 [Beta vulgaris subsp. vulgaris]
MAEIKFISESFAKPKYEVEDAKQSYYLSPIELAMLSIDPIQKGLLYSLNNSSNEVNYDRTKVISHLLEKLKHSLSLALVHFYPLAGRFATRKYPDEHACSVFVDCTKGPGARLIHASAVDVTISDIMSSIDVPIIVRSFFELGEKMVNHDGHTRALLSIQVTELLDGVFIGFTMNHSVVDGTSFIHFLNMLSELFRLEDQFCDDTTTLKISRVPIFNYKPWIDSTICGDNEDVVPVLKLPYLEPEEFISHGYEPGPLREQIFHFSTASLATLKSKANQECGTHNEISSFQALSALVWRSITRVRNLSKDERTCCNISIIYGKRGRTPKY